MELMRESWTDERLDDFRGEVGHRFDGVEQRFDAVDKRFDGIDQRLDRVETSIQLQREELGGEIRDLRAETRAGFERIEDRFVAHDRLMLQLGGVFIAALIGLVATQI
jgi:hypothetical protein